MNTVYGLATLHLHIIIETCTDNSYSVYEHLYNVYGLAFKLACNGISRIYTTYCSRIPKIRNTGSYIGTYLSTIFHYYMVT
jgi:hypothetical protein